MEGPCADSEEKHEPVSGVDIAVAVSLKVLDLDGRLEKRTSIEPGGMSANDPKATFGAQLTVRLENLPPHLSLPAVLGSLLGDQVLAT